MEESKTGNGDNDFYVLVREDADKPVRHYTEDEATEEASRLVQKEGKSVIILRSFKEVVPVGIPVEIRYIEQTKTP